MPPPPKEPSYFDKVNYIIDAWSNPCQAPWYIYVEALKPAALTAFITLSTFGWDDVARGYWRPKGLGRRTGKKRGKGKPRGLRGFPEFGEEIGKRLPGAEEIKARKWGWQGKALWRIDLAAQRLLFWWLVADVTIDFAYNFTSVLYETHWCKQAAKGRFSWHDDGWDVVPGGTWWNVVIRDKDYNILPCNWVTTQGGTGPNPATVVFNVTLRQLVGQPPAAAFQVRLVLWPSQVVVTSFSPQDPGISGTMQFPGIGHMKGGSNFKIQVKHDGVWAQYGDSIVACMED